MPDPQILMQTSNQPGSINQTEGQLAMQSAIINDRNWFDQHPKEIVRFRPALNQEFQQFEELEELPPTFIPSGYSETVPKSWVAVVEIMRLMDAAHGSIHGSLRLRICTVPIRSKANQANAARELIKAISNELLDLGYNDLNDQRVPYKAA